MNDPSAIRPYGAHTPRLGEGVIVMPGAFVIGDVVLGPGCSVWFNAVIRGDEAAIRVGEGTNVQDLVVIHATGDLSEADIGSFVTVGHGAILHGCIVGGHALIGMGATVLDNARVGEYCIVGAGSVVLSGHELPAGHVCVGNPCRPKRPITDQERAFLEETAVRYMHKAACMAGMKPRPA